MSARPFAIPVLLGLLALGALGGAARARADDPAPPPPPVPAPLPAPAPDPAPTPPSPLEVKLTAPRGGQTSERVIGIAGTVRGFPSDRITLVVNGIPMSVGVDGSGAFHQPQVLSPGLNTIRAVAELDGVAAEDAVAVYAQVPAKDLRVTLTWDTPGTDVDLWLTGPDGEKILYSHREGKAGGTLDTDVTTGFGPEPYTQARLQKGTYRVQAHAYRIERPTRVELTVVRFEGTPEEERSVVRGVLLQTNDVLEVGEFTAP